MRKIGIQNLLRGVIAMLVGVAVVGGASGTSGEEPADSLQWLEEVTGEKPLEWVGARNKESTSELTGKPGFQPLNDRLLKVLDSNDKIPLISKAGPWYYNFWRDAKNKRGLWRRTSLEEYRKPQPAWETVLDLDALGAAEKENWVWKGATFLEPDYQRVLLSLSRGGADATVVREFDVIRKEFVADGFTLPEAKSRVAWRGSDSLFVATDFGPGSLTDSGYPRVVKQWKRGTPLSEAVVVFEGQAADVSVSGRADLTPGYVREFLARAVTFWTSELFLRRDDRLIKVEKPDDANASVSREWLYIELRTDWTVEGRTYKAGSLLVTNFDAFIGGARKFDVLFEPTERTSLASFSPTRNHVLVNILDNVRNRVVVHTHKDGKWTNAELPGAPKLSTVGVSAVDSDESDDYFMTVSDYLTPTTLSFGTIGGPPAEKLKGNPSFFNADGLVVKQFEAVSKDGTRIPYFQVSRENLKLDGKNPTMLYGYGGFEIPMVPGYEASTGIAWLEQGGVYVVANIRGGGEFGPKWHQAALKQNRHRAYEDFAAVAEDLIKRQVTSPRHLGIRGGSNGGLLVGNLLTLRPELFNAVVCQVPLLDMRRFNRLLAGASWMAEYGDPDKPEQWEFIRTFSPYHNLKSDGKYPRSLFMTSTRDDRVHPGHARKMVARMKEQGHDVLYFENIEGGHGGAADNKQTAFMWALAYTFLWEQLR